MWLCEPPLQAVTLVAVVSDGVLDDTVEDHETIVKLTALGSE